MAENRGLTSVFVGQCSRPDEMPTQYGRSLQFQRQFGRADRRGTASRWRLEALIGAKDAVNGGTCNSGRFVLCGQLDNL